MSPPIHKLLFLLMFLLCLPARSAELLVHGNEQGMWIVLSTEATRNETPGDRVRIRHRAFGGDSTWRELRTLSGKAVSLASRGDSLAVLLTSGDWLMVWPGGDSVGVPLPDGRKIIEICSDEENLYAVGMPAAESATTSSTNPTTTAAEVRTIYRLAGSKWELLTEAPPEAGVYASPVQMASAGGKLLLATRLTDGRILSWQWDSESGWKTLDEINPRPEARFFDVLNIDGRSAIWATDAAGSATLYHIGSSAKTFVPLPATRTYQVESRRAAIFARGNIREVIFESEGNSPKVFEQCFRTDGTRSTDLVNLGAPRPQGTPTSNFPSLLLLVGLTVLILATVRRGEPEPGYQAGGEVLRLAPLHHRAAAALIDLIPILLAVSYVRYRSAEAPIDTEQLAFPLMASLGIYFLHTTLSELLTGRTLGKWIMGLKVVNLEGRKPGMVPLLVRNLLRAVDVFSPVAIMVFFTPLRQRVGDITARTIVITTREPEPEEEIDDAD